MNNNYYEILEVSKNASKEVIEKAYKVLAKKYHPDLQNSENKSIAEQKMKLINEAYEILSDDSKRQEYDNELEQLELEKRERIIQNQEYKKNTNKQNKQYENEYEYEDEDIDYESMQEELEKQRIEQEKRRIAYEEAQDRAYRNYLRSLGYKVKEKWTWKKFIRLMKIIGIIIIVILVIWIFPPTHKVLIETYEQNPIIKSIVDIIGRVIIGIGNGIGTAFKSIFGIK